MVKVHETSYLHPKAEIDEDVEIGPFCYVGENVKIGRGTRLISHVHISGWTTIGEDNIIYPGASIGTEPQDLKYGGEETYVVVGNGNMIRECVTINRGTAGGGGVTKIGDRCLIMAYSHIAHDCQLGSEIVMSNLATLGGHVVIEDGVWMGGLVGVHHFVTIGKFAFIGGYSKVVKDIPPFCLAVGQPAEVLDINKVGLQRRNFSQALRSELRRAVKILFRSGLNLGEALKRVEEEFQERSSELEYLINFIKRSRALGRMGRLQEGLIKGRE